MTTCCEKCVHSLPNPEKGVYQGWCKNAKCSCHAPAEPRACCKECDVRHIRFAYDCDRPRCECHSEARQEGGGWRERFDQLNKKIRLREETVSGVDEYGLVRNFIEAELKAAEERARREVLEVVKAEMLDKIYHIGTLLPRPKEGDVRNKFVLLGYPKKFLDDVLSRLNRNEGETKV